MHDSHDRRIGVRIPARVADEIEQIATRDANGVSATVRRLLMVALTRERRSLERRGSRASASVEDY